MARFRLLVFTFIIIVSFSCTEKSLYEQLILLPNIVEVNKLDVDTTFSEQYELFFSQPIDHKNPEKGSFVQRVVLSHRSDTLPMVAVLEGYKIWSEYASEPARLLRSNQVLIEHRFFKDSKPDSIPWSDLTIWQAATDQHKIIQALKKIYPEKWLSTGISKGGQTTMYHRSFYPNDVNACIPYVAPLNFAREDERIYKFLNTVGTDEQRKAIFDFQVRCFENEDSLGVLLQEKAESVGWEFKIGYEKAVQYTILEYPFAFWQWGGTSVDDIPLESKNVTAQFNHLNNVAGFTFFEENSIELNRAFFWAALTQIGMYGYETKPFEKFLGDTTNFTFDFTAPVGVEYTYDDDQMQNVKHFLDTDGTNMLYIVGGLDTWGATSYVPAGKNNSICMVLPSGHHGTRIKDFPKKEREYMYTLLEEWMGVEIEDIFE